MEVWKDIPGYEGLYQVSDLGNVKSFWFGKEKILRLVPNKWGYLQVFLYKNDTQKNIKVHRLVYETFIGKTDLKIDHIIEGDKTDNRLSNLQAITQRQNVSKHRLTIVKSSQYIGVDWHKKANKWRACIYVNGKLKHLGLFVNELSASNAYQNALNSINATLLQK